MANSTIILSNQPQMSYTGEKSRGDGFYGFADGLHTVSFHVTNFTGRIYLQATLVENPTEADWFFIQLQQDTLHIEWDNESETLGTSFIGNFVYIRAVVDRSYLMDQNYSPSVHGLVDKVVLMI